jgi:hypothetical protein
MATYTGTTTDYHTDRSGKYYAGSPSYGNNGNLVTSRDQRSSRSIRSPGPDTTIDPRRQRSSREPNRSSPHQTSSRRVASPQDAGYGNVYYEKQSGMTRFENEVNTVTPTDLQTSNHASSSVSQYSQASSQSRRPAYLLHRDLVIGKGSYGQVCIASRGEAEGHNSGTGKRKKFACKCVVLRNDAKYIAKLQEEVNVLRELRGHENIIRLYDVFCVDNELFIITELGRGGDLFHLLTTHPKHGVTEAYAGTFKYFALCKDIQ